MLEATTLSFLQTLPKNSPPLKCASLPFFFSFRHIGINRKHLSFRSVQRATCANNSCGFSRIFSFHLFVHPPPKRKESHPTIRNNKTKAEEFKPGFKKATRIHRWLMSHWNRFAEQFGAFLLPPQPVTFALTPTSIRRLVGSASFKAASLSMQRMPPEIPFINQFYYLPKCFPQGVPQMDTFPILLQFKKEF